MSTTIELAAQGLRPATAEARASDAKAAWHTHRGTCPECGNPNRDLCDIGDDLFFAVYIDRTQPTEKFFGINIPSLIDRNDDLHTVLAERDARIAELEGALRLIRRYIESEENRTMDVYNLTAKLLPY